MLIRLCLAGLAGLGLATASIAQEPLIPKSLPGAAPFEPALREAMRVELAHRGAGYEPRTRHRRDGGAPIYTNRLLLEESPYLQQHAHNPVDWRPWGDAAFEEARRLSRPVLVSIGYSTCHWCHVMEEESFDDPGLAGFLNAHFIAIKVDREARPDVDAIYMAALHAMGQRGGWPLNVFMTPDGKPFYGGTYFPPVDRGGRRSFESVLRLIQESYAEQPLDIAKRADALAAAVRDRLAGGVATQSRVPSADILARALAAHSSAADRTWGGVGTGTKFPSSLPIRLLLREYRRTGNADALAQTRLTLDKMISGGLHDHLGGGFHRYSTERRWLVPHFEKMLYDNALISTALLEAGQATGQPAYLQATRKTLDYLLREMEAPGGGFYSATDADSRNADGELEEGWFFTWTPAELDAVLGPELAQPAAAWFGVTQDGQLDGRSILHTWRDASVVAASLGVGEATLLERVEEASQKLKQARDTRPPPLRDDKILAAWNGLTISALARAGFALDEPRYIDAGRRAAHYVVTEMKRDGRLHRVSLGGRAAGPAFLEDHAFVVAGLIDLYEADFDPRWLREALALQEVLDAHYLDRAGGGYFRTADDGEMLLAREKPLFGGALPSGNAVAASNLQRLGALTGDRRYLDQLNLLYAAFYDAIEKNPSSVSELLVALSDQLAEVREVVVVAPAEGGDLDAMLAPLRTTFTPNQVLVVTREGETLAALKQLVPPISGKRAINGQVTAYVCVDHTCQYPATQPADLLEQLRASDRPRAAQGVLAP